MCTTTEVELSAPGREQAAALGHDLAGVEWAHAWSSPLTRAQETLSSILGADAQVARTEDFRLREPDGGPFEGVTFKELYHGRLAQAFAAYQDEDSPVIPEGAVNPADAAVGTAAFLKMISAMPGRHIAVSHGALMRIMAVAFLGLPASYYRRLRIDNCHGALWKFYPVEPHQLSAWNVR